MQTNNINYSILGREGIDKVFQEEPYLGPEKYCLHPVLIKPEVWN